MDITYNALRSPSNVVTFTDVPNILKVTDTTAGTKCDIRITLSPSLFQQVTSDKQYYITILGDTVNNVIQPSQAVNKLFVISQSPSSTAASLARALRNCQVISVNFTIVSRNDTVYMTARNIGSILSQMDGYYETNIPSQYITTNITEGSAQSPLYGALIDVDVYSDGEYITTLEKNFFGGETAFDLSPVLTTMAQEGYTVPYELQVSSLLNGEYTSLGSISENYITYGYMVNQGYKYLALAPDTAKMAQNFYRDGEQMTLYIYEPQMVFTFYLGYNRDSAPLTMTYLNSAFQEVGQLNTTLVSSGSQDARLKLVRLNLRQDWFTESFYIDVNIGGETVRYNIIKPVKATEYCQRVYWRNSYGGVSFFDFTGKKTETRSLDAMTYEGNLFDYYEDSTNTLDRVYDTDVEYKVTLKTHIMEKKGTYIFNDMIQSADAWTNVDGSEYRIIIESFSMEESDINDTYTCQITYRYSQNPTLI